MVKVGDVTMGFKMVSAPTPPNIVYSDLQASPVEVKPGEEVTVTATAKNTGETTGIFLAELVIDDSTREVKNGSLTPGASTTFTWKIKSDVEGTHTLKLKDLQTTFKVVKPATPSTTSNFTLWIAAGAIVGIIALAGYMFLKRR